jgi:hypothetical protein
VHVARPTWPAAKHLRQTFTDKLSQKIEASNYVTCRRKQPEGLKANNDIACSSVAAEAGTRMSQPDGAI